MINTVELERMTVGAQQAFNAELMGDFGMPGKVSIEGYPAAEYMGRNLAMMVRQHVYGEHLDQRTVRYPATWRDAVKDRLYYWLRHDHWPWGADLLEARYPVKWHEVTIDVTALYPKISMPQDRHSIKIAQMHDTSDQSQRLWFDAQKMGMNNAVFELYYHGRIGRSWSVDHIAYRRLLDMRDGSGRYVIEPSFQSSQLGVENLMGMKVIIDRDMPKGTIELRDKDDRIVGKIYNIS